MKTAPPGWLPRADPEALIKEARRRQRRRHMAMGLALVVILGGATGITVNLTAAGSHGPRGSPSPSPKVENTPSSGAFAQSVLPPFFADAVTTGEGNGPLQVRVSASGRLVAQERNGAGVSALAAAGTDSFLIALQVGDGCATRMYRVQLGDRGRPGRLSPLGPELHGLVWSLAGSAGDRVISYAVSGCAKGDPGYIGVFDAGTQRSRQWGGVNLGGVSPGNVAMNGALSMSADGRLLAFTGWNMAGSGLDTSQVVRVLPTDAPAGNLAERSRVVLTRPVSQPELAAVSLSPSGASIYLCTQTGTRTGRVTTIASYRTSTGELQQNLAGLRGTSGQMGCSMALDASGQFLLVPYSLGPAGRPVLKVAEIDIAARTVATLTIQLPGSAGMDSPTGMIAAW